eukprot:scaffold26293_cov99-Amphora_coffeaeformis.AAC.1
MSDDSPLVKALKDYGVCNLSDFLSLSAQDIEDLTHEVEDEGSKSRIPIPKGNRRIVTVFFDFIKFREHQGNPIGDNWTGISSEEFDGFRTST